MARARGLACYGLRLTAAVHRGILFHTPFRAISLAQFVAFKCRASVLEIRYAE